MSPSVWPSLLAFLVVIAAIPLALFGLQRLRFGGSTRQQGLRVEQSLSLGPRERLVIVQTGRERLLLGVTAQSIQMLERLGPAVGDTAEAAPSEPGTAPAVRAMPSGFAQLLGRQMNPDR